MKLIVQSEKQGTFLPKIMKAALRLFVERGIDSTTTKEIAKAAGVAEGALYRHFKSKDELAWHLFSTHLNRFTDELAAAVFKEAPGRPQIQAFVRGCFSSFEEDRVLFTYLAISEHKEFKKYSNPAAGEESKRNHPGQIVRKMVETGQQAGVFRSGDSAVLGSLLLGAVIRACVVRMYGTITRDLRECVDEAVDALGAMLKV